MSVKQSIEIETKNHTTLMMGVTPAGQFKTSETNTHANTPSNRTLMNHKPNRFNDILTNIVTGVTITAWGTAVILLLIKLAIWVFQ